MRNLITDVAGLRVGHATDMALASGVTALVFDAPAVASIAIGGGAPGTRDTSLLEPGMTVETVDALVLSGGSAFGLDSMGGVQSWLREQGRGFPVRDMRVPIVPGAILFDLLNGGNKAWGRHSPYRDLGYEAAATAGLDFALGSVGAGAGATLVDVKGGLGSASAVTPKGFTVGAMVAVNAIGSALVGPGPHFWAAPYERDGEFGGRGWPGVMPDLSRSPVKGVEPENTTIAIVATDAALTRAQAKRIAMMAQDGMARTLRPAHAAFDGDLVMSASTARHMVEPEAADLLDIGVLAADCLARAIARAIFEARALEFPGALPAWRDLFG
ncbi:MAG: putative enzyme [Hyphomicrobiales bacterium]|nr:putative enzyme [Hyphomicrobiales bacterium]